MKWLHIDETNIVKNELGSKFKLKDLGEIKECLGMQVNYDKEKDIIRLSKQKMSLWNC